MTLLKRSMLRVTIPIIIIFVPMIFLLHKASNSYTMQHTKELFNNKMQNYCGKVSEDLNSMRNVLQALGAVFYHGSFEEGDTTLEIFTNFTTLYPDSTGFYGEVDGTYYDGTGWDPGEGWIPSERPWYKAAETKPGNVVFSDVYLDDMTGVNVVSVSEVVLDDKGKSHGVVALDYPLGKVIDTVEMLKEGTNDKLFILTENGNFAVSDLFTADDKIDTVENGKYATIASALMEGTTEFVQAEIQNQKYFLTSAKIADTGWILVLGSPISDVFSFSRQISFLLIISFTILAVLILVLIAFSLAGVALPLKTMAKALSAIASGEGDLTKRLEIERPCNEMVLIRDSFNQFMDKLQEIISEVKDTKGDLFIFGEQLGGIVQENGSNITGIINNIKDVNTELGTQHEKVDSSVKAVGDISSAVEELHNLLETQENGVATASSAVTQMIGNIDSVSRSVEKMATEFSALQGDVGDGINRQREVSKQIQDIEEQSKMLNEANEVISSIAEQTNLLAMNAAIEAAHAGEAGKGFSVVADEIRKLSEDSSEQSNNIGKQLSSILNSISNVVVSSDISDQVFTNVSQKINDTGDLVRQIKQAMEEQSEGSKQISEALGYMNDATSQVRGAANNVDNARTGITEDVESLRQASDAVWSLLEKLKIGVKNIEKGDEASMNISTSINGSIYRINTQIDQFKV